MKKSAWVTILIIIILVAGLGAVWYSAQQSQKQQEAQPETSQPTPQNEQENAGPEQVTESENKVAIKEFAYSPATITVKKGTTVTWTNEDTIGHNVVASDAANTGGLPTSAPLLAQGKTFTHTFNEVGSFEYHCTPHPHMKGMVEVVE